MKFQTFNTVSIFISLITNIKKIMKWNEQKQPNKIFEQPSEYSWNILRNLDRNQY